MGNLHTSAEWFGKVSITFPVVRGGEGRKHLFLTNLNARVPVTSQLIEGEGKM
jgi:hypothetical protein